MEKKKEREYEGVVFEGALADAGVTEADLRRATRRGNRKVKVDIEYVRDVTLDDLTLLAQPAVAKGPVIQRLRNSHHRIARMLAEGDKTIIAVSEASGYSPSRISALQSDPSFKELVEYYRGKIEEQYLDVHGQLADLGMDMFDEIRHRLDQDPEQFTITQLLTIGEKLLNKTVAPDKTKLQPNSGNDGPAQIPNFAINFISNSKDNEPLKMEVVEHGKETEKVPGNSGPQERKQIEGKAELPPKAKETPGD